MDKNRLNTQFKTHPKLYTFIACRLDLRCNYAGAKCNLMAMFWHRAETSLERANTVIVIAYMVMKGCSNKLGCSTSKSR